MDSKEQGNDSSPEKDWSEEGEGKGETFDSDKTARINDYKARRESRAQRLRARAGRRQTEGQGLLNRADTIASFIPPGQPILVGHHSERRHRRDLERIHTSTRKGLAALQESEELERRADASESNTAIFTEDPEAKDKLQAKINSLEKAQELMKEVNRRIRRGQSLSDLGISQEAEAKLKKPDHFGRIGFPDFKLTNNGANIRRLKLRLGTIAKVESLPTPEPVEENGIRLVENVDLNRVQLFFPGKPSEEVRTQLKRSGFRWSPSEGCWQRHRSAYASELARGFLKGGSAPA